MTGPQPDVSVVVVTHNGREKALAALASARRSAGAAATQWLVVDCGSTDGTPDAIHESFADIDLIRRSNLGFAAGNNVALARAVGRYVLLLNPDVEIIAGSLEALVDAMDRRPAVGAAGVVHRDADGAMVASTGRFPSPLRHLGEALRLASVPGLRRWQEMEAPGELTRLEHSVDWTVGAFLIVRAEALAAVGGLDERFFLYSEEQDLCYRIHEAGWDVRHLPTVEILHHAGGYDAPRLAQLTYSKLLFAQKHFGPLGRATIRLALVLRHGIRWAALAGRPGNGRERSQRERGALAVALGRGRGLDPRVPGPSASPR